MLSPHRWPTAKGWTSLGFGDKEIAFRLAVTALLLIGDSRLETATAIALLVLPLCAAPVAYGINPIHFGVMIVRHQ